MFVLYKCTCTAHRAGDVRTNQCLVLGEVSIERVLTLGRAHRGFSVGFFGSSLNSDHRCGSQGVSLKVSLEYMKVSFKVS